MRRLIYMALLVMTVSFAPSQATAARQENTMTLWAMTQNNTGQAHEHWQSWVRGRT